MLRFILISAVTLFFAGACRAAVGADGICRPTCTADECTFNVRLNLYASETGLYQFEECNGAVSPTLGIEVGKVHRFIQQDQTNWMHPLGFAYFPDGAHVDVDELEPGIPPPGATDQSCADDNSCPAPMYFVGGEYVGTYSNIPNVNGTAGSDNFGLDDFEPLFFHPPAEWTSYGSFEVLLLIPEMDGFVGDIFYFCHIHSLMSGRIKLLKDNEALQPLVDLPELDYSFSAPSAYDEMCGTSGLDEWQLPHPQCPERFVCDVPSENSELEQFSSCIDSMNCHMFAGMTTGVKSEDEVALFLHQMIPHHQNAVNMAKALLKANKVQCEDLGEETDDCNLKIILLEIVNTQNHQIQSMQSLLESYGFPPSDDCVVDLASGETADAESCNSQAGFMAAAGALLAAL